MGIFNDIPIGWHDEEFIIPANRVLKAIAAIEENITLHEIFTYSERGAMPPLSKMAMAYGAVLRMAGARVSDEEAYEFMFSGNEQHSAAMDALNGLLSLMMPASKVAEFRDKGKDNKPGNSRRAGAKSSKRSIKRSPAWI